MVIPETGAPLLAPSILAMFATPALLYAGGAMVAAPILIHLLSRRRFKRVRWAAMDFLLIAQRRNRRRLRMEEWLLLALRCLAILAIAALVARPFLAPGVSTLGLTGGRRIERVFLLDDSLSMSARGPSGSSFDRAKTAVRKIIDGIRLESPDDSATLALMTRPEEPMESGAYLDEKQSQELLARLEAVGVSQRAVEPEAVMKSLAAMLERGPDVSGIVLYVISDFQRNGWTATDAGLSSNRRSVGPFAPVLAWAKSNRGLRVVLVNVGDSSVVNASISDAAPTSGAVIAGAASRIVVEVSNHSDRPAQDLPVVAKPEQGAPVVQLLAELAPRSSTKVDFDVEFHQPRDQSLRLEIPSDSLSADNVRHLVTQVLSSLRILIVNGEPSADLYSDETTFLTTALRPDGRVFSGNEPTVINESELDSVELSGFHVIALANVYRVSDAAMERMERFVSGGGGLVIFAGDLVDPDLYNGGLYRGGQGVLPARLGEMVRPASPVGLVVTDRGRPVLAGMAADGDPLGIGSIAFSQYLICTVETPSAEGLEGSVAPGAIKSVAGDLRLGTDKVDGPHGAAGAVKSSTVLARFSASEDHAAIVERRFGQGRVVLVASSIDKEWNDWPDHPTFVPMVLELFRYAAPPGGKQAQRLVGETIDLIVDPSVYEPDASVRTPEFPAVGEAPATAKVEDDGRMHLRWRNTDAAGLYQVQLRRRDDGSSVGQLIAVNPDPAESDLRSSGEEELRQSMPELKFEYFSGAQRLASGTGESRVELWRWALLLAGLVLMLEQTLAWLWGRRR